MIRPVLWPPFPCVLKPHTAQKGINRPATYMKNKLYARLHKTQGGDQGNQAIKPNITIWPSRLTIMFLARLISLPCHMWSYIHTPRRDTIMFMHVLLMGLYHTMHEGRAWHHDAMSTQIICWSPIWRVVQGFCLICYVMPCNISTCRESYVLIWGAV